MILNPKPLRVVANPYHTLDNQGLPSGAARLDPEASAGQRLYIGAILSSADPIAKRSAQEMAAGLAPMVQANRWTFSAEPVEIDDTPYHRSLLRQGAVLAADEGTHRRVGAAKNRPFVSPEKAIAIARGNAVALWKSEHDGEAPAFLAEEETQTTPAPAGEER